VKALVIGASGLVGGALVRVLERNGADVVGASRSRPVPGGLLLDVRDAEAVAAAFAAVQPALAFLAIVPPGGVDACEDHPQEAAALQVDGTRHVAEAAARHGARLVYFSTDYVFDGKAGPYAETDEPRPLNVYGATKLEAERLVSALVPRHLIVRTTTVFGWDRASRNFAMQVSERLGAGQPLRVADDQWANPTLAEYLAEATVQLVGRETTGIVNVVGRDRMARSDLARALARAMALDPDLVVPVSTVALGQRAARPLQGGLVTRRLEDLLGTAPLDLDESLKRFRRHWRADTHTAARPAAPSAEAARLKAEILDRVRRYHALAHAPAPFVPFRSRVQYAGRVFGAEEMVNLVDSALDFWLTLGPYGERFEQAMKRLLGCRDFVLVNSGSSANLTAVLALTSRLLDDPLRPGDEVITPAVTFPTTLAPLVHGGLVPVFVDCEVGTYNVDPRLLEAAVSPRTRAIMVPHTLGVPCDLDVIGDLARRHGLYLVEDACDALGATFRGRPVGTFGDLATLSFFPAHHITMGEGGGVIVNTARLGRVVRSARDWGRDCWCAPGESNSCGQRFGWQLGDLPRGYDHKYVYSTLGYNFKPTDLQAAVGVAQLDRLPDFVARRRRNFERLYRVFEPYREFLVLPTRDPRSEPSWFAFTLTVQHGLARQELVQWLETANIETRQVFGGNILKQPAFRDIPCRVAGSLEATDRIMRDTFFIGVYPGLTDPMIDFIGERVADFFARR
jgi:CDP-6-deoxy-D-xylo-4-hexulose-3-dehydrase